MPYVSRDQFNNVTGIFEIMQPGLAEEFVEGQRPSPKHVPNNGVWALAAETIQETRAAMQCTNSQFRRALTQLGWRADVEAAVAAAGQDIQDMYEYDTVFYRSRAEFSQIAAVINKTEADIDSVFELAITLP